MTARSDLAALESEGLLIRTHGGAVPSRHPKLMKRMQTKREEKSAIAQTAASLIDDGETVILQLEPPLPSLQNISLAKRCSYCHQ